MWWKRCIVGKLTLRTFKRNISSYYSGIGLKYCKSKEAVLTETTGALPICGSNINSRLYNWMSQCASCAWTHLWSRCEGANPGGHPLRSFVQNGRHRRLPRHIVLSFFFLPSTHRLVTAPRSHVCKGGRGMLIKNTAIISLYSPTPGSMGVPCER